MKKKVSRVVLMGDVVSEIWRFKDNTRQFVRAPTSGALIPGVLARNFKSSYLLKYSSYRNTTEEYFVRNYIKNNESVFISQAVAVEGDCSDFGRLSSRSPKLQALISPKVSIPQKYYRRIFCWQFNKE